MAGDAAGQVEEGVQPGLLGFAPASDSRPSIGPADDGTDGDEEDGLEGMVGGCISARIGDHQQVREQRARCLVHGRASWRNPTPNQSVHSTSYLHAYALGQYRETEPGAGGGVVELGGSGQPISLLGETTHDVSEKITCDFEYVSIANTFGSSEYYPQGLYTEGFGGPECQCTVVIAPSVEKIDFAGVTVAMLFEDHVDSPGYAVYSEYFSDYMADGGAYDSEDEVNSEQNSLLLAATPSAVAVTIPWMDSGNGYTVVDDFFSNSNSSHLGGKSWFAFGHDTRFRGL